MKKTYYPPSPETISVFVRAVAQHLKATKDFSLSSPEAMRVFSAFLKAVSSMYVHYLNEHQFAHNSDEFLDKPIERGTVVTHSRRKTPK